MFLLCSHSLQFPKVMLSLGERGGKAEGGLRLLVAALLGSQHTSGILCLGTLSSLL